jgi:hypothetical protein
MSDRFDPADAVGDGVAAAEEDHAREGWKVLVKYREGADAEPAPVHDHAK